VIGVAREYALAQLERHGPVAAWVVDDSGFPKKGTHSVGVARQYCGPMGKQDNCQVAVTLSLVNSSMSVPCAYRLYLPESWAGDHGRRRAAAIPDEIGFPDQTGAGLGADRSALADDVPRAPVVADAGYGSATEFRQGLTVRGLSYAVGIMRETTVWPQGYTPLPPPRSSGRGRPATRLRRDPEQRPVSLRVLAPRLERSSWQTVRWREGTRGAMQSRFALTRVRPAHRDHLRIIPHEPEFLLIEWPQGEPELPATGSPRFHPALRLPS
jgi:SRSO17 transposase